MIKNLGRRGTRNCSQASGGAPGNYDELRRVISEKTDEISNIQTDLENKNSTLKAQVFISFKLLPK